MGDGQQKYQPPLVDEGYLGNYDAMVVIRSKDNELAFVMSKDMSVEVFHANCESLRQLVLR